MTTRILALDQGTTSTRAVTIGPDLQLHGMAQEELGQSYPKPGQVEHDPEEIWRATLSVCKRAAEAADARGAELRGIGITNQRETVLLWDAETGVPIHPALVWQDRRTASLCARWRSEGAEDMVRSKTGLLLDPYFSASKISWLLEEIPGARTAAEAGRLRLGTVDCFLIWRMTGGQVHATDASNASRTLLFNIHSQEWDEELLRFFNIPASLLPEVRDSNADFGVTSAEISGRSLPIRGVLGDQQAATWGQGCLEPGSMKCTFGTGCFVLLNTGSRPIPSHNRMLTTVAWRLNGATEYALEGSVYNAGSTIQWLRDGLGILKHAQESEALAAQADPRSQVHLVPAFTGLGAPWWDPDARGALLGLTRGSGPAEITLAALESVGHQTADLLESMRADGAPASSSLRVDGGLSSNGLAMQFLADILDLTLERPTILETTIVGAGRMAALGLDLPDWPVGAPPIDRRFSPDMDQEERQTRRAAWASAVARILSS